MTSRHLSRTAIAAAVLGGLTVSTVLSLVVVPAFYVVTDRMKIRVFGKKKVPAQEHTAPHPVPPHV